ncbi:hypothetical protein E8E12_000091 [Didymella heteroderae]|uniref:Chromo domain-containing protein n=1 Tax=Didymella heteroderae TaxID=1769908 RepID=A0A9P4WX64_9PLEO|nr:hypothetical protein E8E12_000091 [Didymella heteroderae]
MSIRGPRGRGRGRGRGRTMVWEWETYTPSPAVYDNIWHVRQAPVALTPTLPCDCPIPNTRTRILERRQTEDGFGRNFYLVEMIKDGTEIQTVDVSRILQYVSPRELERFENEQFRVEAKAQAIADKAEEDERVRRRMAKNARATGSGRGRGSRMLNGRGIDPELPARSRGRGRGRTRGNTGRRGGGGRGGLALSRELPEEETVNGEPSQTLATSYEDTTDASSGDEEQVPRLASPNLMRSAFVANSALPLSPVQPIRPVPSPVLQRGHPEVPDIGGTDTGDSQDEDRHRSKRRRMESVTPQRRLRFSSSLQDDESNSEEDSIPPDPPSTVKAHKFHRDDNTSRAGHSMLQKPAVDINQAQDDNEDNEGAEEYAVEAIVEHFHDEERRKLYLVKWEGYEDSHDWLSEGDLEGAAELVHDYDERVKQQEGGNRPGLQ